MLRLLASGLKLKEISHQSGINTFVFTIHSTRHASTSAANNKPLIHV